MDPLKFCFYCKSENGILRQCTNCKKVAYCSKRCQQKDWENHKELCRDPNLIVWGGGLVENFLNLMIESIDIFKVLYIVDRSAAQEYRSKHQHHCCDKHHLIEWSDDMTQLESILYELTSRSRLHELLPRFASETGQIFLNIKTKGEKDGLCLDSETEKQLLKQVLEESMTRTLAKEINAYHRHEEETYSKQPLLLAYPSGYQETVNSELDSLHGETMRSFMETDYAVQDNFLEDSGVLETLYKETEFLDIDGRFEEILQQKMQNIRTDKILWVKKVDLDKASASTPETPLQLALSYCPGMKLVLNSLFSLAFEINKKTSLGLQLTDGMCIDCFSQSTFYIAHKDSNFGKNDTGRKVSCLYFVSKSSANRLKINGNEVEVKNNRLIILKSRKVQYEILPAMDKFFIYYWFIPGPADPYQ